MTFVFSQSAGNLQPQLIRNHGNIFSNSINEQPKANPNPTFTELELNTNLLF